MSLCLPSNNNNNSNDNYSTTTNNNNNNNVSVILRYFIADFVLNLSIFNLYIIKTITIKITIKKIYKNNNNNNNNISNKNKLTLIV